MKTKIYYYLVNDPNKTIMTEDIEGSVAIIPDFAVVSTDLDAIVRAQERAARNIYNFKKQMENEVAEELER